MVVTHAGKTQNESKQLIDFANPWQYSISHADYWRKQYILAIRVRFPCPSCLGEAIPKAKRLVVFGEVVPKASLKRNQPRISLKGFFGSLSLHSRWCFGFWFWMPGWLFCSESEYAEFCGLLYRLAYRSLLHMCSSGLSSSRCMVSYLGSSYAWLWG